jgi:hypothetical protein
VRYICSKYSLMLNLDLQTDPFGTRVGPVFELDTFKVSEATSTLSRGDLETGTFVSKVGFYDIVL